MKYGNDPYSMWKTMTDGVGQMMAQIQYTPEERYATIHYIREQIFRTCFEKNRCVPKIASPEARNKKMVGQKKNWVFIGGWVGGSGGG